MAGVAEELKLANLQPQIAECRHQLNGSARIDVAVFGRFKAGKSSFLNHLAGHAVLPIGVVPLTAVITRLRYGSIERAEVLAFVRQQLRRKWEADFPVFFYSVRPEEHRLKLELEQNLLSPLIRNRSEAAVQIGRHKLHSLVGQTLNYLRIALAAATQAESSRQALREKLVEERGQFDLLRSELSVLSRQWSANAFEWSLARLQPTQAALQAKITQQLHEQFPRWNLRLPPLLEAWRDWLGVFLTRELGELSHAQAAMFREPFYRVRQHLTRTLRAFHDRLAEHVKAALGVTLTPREFVLEVPEPAAPPVDVAYAFEVALCTIGWLIPLTLFRRPIERVLLRKARWEVEKNLSRLAAAWRDRVAIGIEELIRQAEQRALDELRALEQTLAQAASNVPELRKAIHDLEGNQLHDKQHVDRNAKPRDLNLDR